LKPASDAGQRAIAKMTPDKGLKIELWAAEPLLANPVALNFDDKGRCFLLETWRFEQGVIDMRVHMDWLDDDLASKSVEDRIALVRRKMGPNWRSFGKYPDVLRLIEDTKGEGKADKSTVFAEFHELPDGIASGVVTRKNDVYVTNIPNLWLLRDTKGDGHADVKKSLSYGYGIRYNFLGHDLHGPRFGPDGKLYFTIGDRAANITQSVDNTHVENLESGCVFRCNPDGSKLEIFATGLRNPQSLAFDDYGNLFSGDNNPDYGDPARWVYLVEGGDSGWRVGYQYDHNPIGGGPWMSEHLWQEQKNSTAAYLLPPVKDLGAGPAGVAYYPGTGLSHDYDRHFFECDFRGGFTGSGVHTFTMEPDGAGFKMADLHHFVWNTLATDIVFGPQGGVYLTDWVEGWHVSGVGRIYHVFDPQAMADPIVNQVKDLLAEGFEKRTNEELIKLLAHRDQRIRQRAQFELADRGAAVIPLLAQTAQRSESQLARIHAIWALGQIGVNAKQALDPLLTLLDDPDPEIRAQMARVLADHHDPRACVLIKRLDDPSPRVRYFATMALSTLGTPTYLPSIVQEIRENADKDVYIRHAGVMALTRINDWKTIQSAAKDDSRSVRLAALLAMRKLGRPEIARFLHDADPQLVLEAARAINDLPIVEALPQLASLIENTSLPDYVMIRVVNANFRLGTADSARVLAKFAASDAPRRWRVQALADLAGWQTPGRRDKVTNLTRPLPDRDPAIARDAAAPVLASLLHNQPNSVVVAALDIINKLSVKDSAVLEDLATDAILSSEVRVSAINTMAAQNDPKLAEVVDASLKDHDEHIRAAAIEALAKLPDAVARIAPFLEDGSPRSQQAALAAIAQVPGQDADRLITSWLQRLTLKTSQPQTELYLRPVSPLIELDIVEAAEKRGDPEVQRALDHYNRSLSKSDPLAPYRVAMEGGDADAGDKIFHLRTDVSCIRCHTVHGTGGIVGPVLDGVGSRQNREYLLESIVFPNAKIAQGFEGVLLKLKDGRTVAGIVKKDTDTDLEVLDADAHLTVVPKADIVTRQRGQSAMPEDLVKLLSKRDLRDLVEYLASLKN
ncbi:MAG TPA: PVC-type heme-binding CxxCH protein, partial [Tepidisphaeraceae bacterium]|nr:PVC-type heme-binding CxxCH protein [Tepidisphaeraceae bacterium]